MNPFVDFDCSGEQAARAARHALEDGGLQVVRSFDLLGPGSDACRCPKHGTPRCSCQYSVLLVYPIAGPPAAVTAHAYDGRTRLEIALDPNAPPDAGLVGRILASLIAASGTVAGASCLSVPGDGALPA